MSKIKVQSITITRIEGPLHLCDKPKTFRNYNAAHSWLLSYSHTFPKTGGYNKHDFSITFEDESVYSGRLDCKHLSCKDNDLDIQEHIRSMAEWHSGQAKDPWCGAEKYKEFMAQEDPRIVTMFKELHNYYEI